MQKETYGKSYRYTITTGGHEDSWDLNPPSDLAFVKQTFGLLVRYSKLLGVDQNDGRNRTTFCLIFRSIR